MCDGMKHGVFRTPEPAKRLRVYVRESDKCRGVPLHEAVVLKARELHLAGATVLRGPMGFGANSRIHTAKILRLSAAFIPHLEAMVTGGLVTIEDVGVLIYSPAGSAP